MSGRQSIGFRPRWQPSGMQSSFKRLLLYVIVFASGAAAIGYQLAWTRMFTTGFGHEIAAVLAVVTAFFFGLALGAALLHRPVSRASRPDFWYGALEWTIGIWAIITTGLIPLANRVAADWMGLEPTPVRHWLITFAVPFLALLPATIAMGGTLPAAERWIARATSDGLSLGALYAVNTLGAVAGLAACTANLFSSWGYSRTVVLLGLLNLACGAGAVALADFTSPETRVADLNQSASRPGVLAPDREPAILVTLFLTGLLGIGFEVLGVRALAQVLEGTVYTFATTLAVYLAGTTIGAALYHWRLRRQPFEPLKQRLVLLLACSCAIGIVFVGSSQTLFHHLRATWGDVPWVVTLVEIITAAAVFALPTVLMGALFTHLSVNSCQRESGVGLAIAWNTLGCAIAPTVFGLVLLPVLQLKWAFVFIVAGYGLLLWPHLIPLLIAGLIVLCVALLPSTRFQFVLTSYGARILSSRDGVMDSVAVVGYPDGNRSLIVDSRYTMGGTGSAIAERRHAQIPLLLHPEPKRALFLGVGTGITFGAAKTHPGLEADGAELVPEVIEAMPFFSPLNDTEAQGSRQRVHAIDARRFVRCKGASYDVIVADLFHPARDGAGLLYTLEHFQAIRRRLAPGGLFCQWLPLHQLDERMLKVIVRTFLEVFPNSDAVLLRYNVDTPVIGLIGRTNPSGYSPGWFESRVKNEVLKTQLKSLAITDDIQLFGCWLAGPEMLRTFSRDSEINTDDRPVVMFDAPRFYYFGKSSSYGRLLTLLDLPKIDGEGWIQGTGSGTYEGFRDRLRRFISARDVYLRGLVKETEGNMTGALDTYLESARLSPDFSTGHARCLTIAAQLASSEPQKARFILERLIEARPENPVARELLDRLNRR